MVLNPYFTQGTNSEQNLVQDLINEQLRTYGIEIYYIPRKYIGEKTVIREVVKSKFDVAVPLEAYVDNYDEYSGAGNLLSKFGIQSQDEVRLVISRERFENYITPLIEDQANIKLSTRPKTGDLIWFPLDDRLYEIKDIEYAKPYYQLQDLYTYELTCELYRLGDEVIDTGVDDIDDNLVGDDLDGDTDDGIGTIQGVVQTFIVVGTGATASAITGLVDGGIKAITMGDRGGGYDGNPTVAISSAPSGGVTGIATAVMIGGINVCNLNANPRLRSVQATYISNAGSGYTEAPKIKFISNTGAGATATVGISTTGGVGIVTVSSGGNGYTSVPTVTFSTPKHVGAAATATIENPVVGGGVSVTKATISVGSSAYLFPGGTTGGVFYKVIPTVTFSLPTGTANAATATATLDDKAVTGGTVLSVGITSGGKFYTSAPTVTISAPVNSGAAATIGIAGSSVNPSSIAFSTTGRAYTTAPTVAITTSSGQDAPTQAAVGIVTIHSITGVVTAVGFNTQTDSWAAGTAATIGSGYTAAPTLTFSGATAQVRATATATISAAGTVTAISVGNSGFGYLNTPTVSIESAGGADEAFRALGVATMRLTSVKADGTVGIGSTYMTGITTTSIIVGDRVRLSAGSSDTYNFIPADTYVSQIGYSTIYMSAAASNVSVASSNFEFGLPDCGIVTGIAVTFGGGGYLTPPTVSISNTEGDKDYVARITGITTATGIATMSSGGVVTNIDMTDTGFGYVLTPTVTLSDPDLDSTGDYKFNEQVTGQTSGATGRVRTWSSSSNQLEIASVVGTFLIGEDVKGDESGAIHALRTKDDMPDAEDSEGFAANKEIEDAADSILDFSEQNPFGIP